MFKTLLHFWKQKNEFWWVSSLFRGIIFTTRCQASLVFGHTGLQTCAEVHSVQLAESGRKPAINSVKVWTEEVSSGLLWDHRLGRFCCGGRPDYINFWAVMTITLKMFPNQNPWFNRELRLLLKDRNFAFRQGDQLVYKKITNWPARASERPSANANCAFRGTSAKTIPEICGEE